MLLLENIKLALIAIRVNKMRSFLTMLGMIIGISSVIAIVSIGDSMRLVISDVYKDIGMGLVQLYIQSDDDYYSNNDMFSFDDMEKLKEAFGDRIVYLGTGSMDTGTIQAGRSSIQIANVGVPENYSQAQTVSIVSGRMISNDDVALKKKHIVIEDKLAKKLYGAPENAVGKTMRVSIYKEFDDLLVVGVYKNTQSVLTKMLMGNGGMDGSYVPETLMMKSDDTFWMMNLYVSPDTDATIFRQQFVAMLARMKNKTPDEIVYYAANEEMKSMDSMMETMSLAVGAIAAISLVVGGIGIMNIMLVSVTERTREIGIRKALGARTGDVLTQFLVESAIISAFGGIIGTSLGVGVVLIGGIILNTAVVVRPTVVITAVIFSAVVGIFFGLYPAQKAAKADPITALRYE